MEVAGQQPVMLPGTSPFRVEEGSTSGHAGLDPRSLSFFFNCGVKRQENPFVPSGSFVS